METIEYHSMDKSQWIFGPWFEEPDKKQWLDEKTGLPCLIVRGEVTGSLCGYVGVKKGHPCFEKEHSELECDILVHGGLTFSGKCHSSEDESQGICHKSDDIDDVWWLGFDTAHSFDLMPKMESLHLIFPDFPQRPQYLGKDEYRDLAYVTNEVENLARQLAEIK